MKRFRFLMPFGMLAIISLFSTVIMLLWNWLMPLLFGLITINFWQAAGLFILARILFGGLGFGKMMNARHINPIHKKWMRMTPEQREEFIRHRQRFGFGHPFHRGHCDFGTGENDIHSRKHE